MLNKLPRNSPHFYKTRRISQASTTMREKKKSTANEGRSWSELQVEKKSIAEDMLGMQGASEF